MDPVSRVKESTSFVVSNATHVALSDPAIEKLATRMAESETKAVEWDAEGWHYCEDAAVEAPGPVTCQYVFVLDALNFCFWPKEGLEYDHLASSLTKVLKADKNSFDADRLLKISADEIQSWFGDLPLPNIDERVIKLRELGSALVADFDGLAANMVAKAGNSAVKLVDLIVKNLPGFRDETVYKGRQIFLYKRAQILVGDLWAAYGRQGPSHKFGFGDINRMTMFADYRVPQILRVVGVLEYSEELAKLVDARETLAPGSEMEVEIRAATVQAVERLVVVLASKGRVMSSVEVDWLLWQEGERDKDKLAPHHRTLSVFY